MSLINFATNIYIFIQWCWECTSEERRWLWIDTDEKADFKKNPQSSWYLTEASREGKSERSRIDEMRA